MKQLKQLSFLLLLLLSMPFTRADLDFFEASATVEGDTVKHTIVMIFYPLPKTLEYPILMPVENLEIRANFKGHECQQQAKSWGVNILCNLSSASGGNTLGISFQSSSGIKTLETHNVFELGVKVPENTKKAVVKGVLGEGLYLIEERGEEDASSVVPFYPRDGQKGSDGRRIYVVWERINLVKGDPINVGLAYEGAAKTESNYAFLILPIPLLAILFLLFRRFEKGLKAIIPVLKEDERKIIEILQSSGGRCRQRKIVADTAYSKARVSRLVHNLKERGLIDVIPRGRTNEVILKELKPLQ